jgi:sigma-B regulation protein RsbU (phosphoserine phosphatase)
MLSSQIAASLAKIELLEEVVDKKVLEEELNLARSIQLNLLPSTAPRLDRYEVAALSVASKQVGGDYYDFIKRGKLLSIAVADVAGKGVPGSLLMASLQASLRSMLDKMDDPVEVVGRLNDVMCDITAPDKFATLFYGCLHLDKNELRYTNAGHTFPIILKGDGSREILDYSGLILGVKHRFSYEGHRVKMRPGDTLIVTTDGVTEAEGGNGRLYGEGRFLELLPELHGLGAEEVKNTIVRDVNRFSHPVGASDDLTILVLKRVV